MWNMAVARFCLFLLVIMKTHCSDSALTELEGDENLNLQCLNDYEEIFCQFRPTVKQPNCANYTLKLIKQRSSIKCSLMEYGEGSSGRCHCRLPALLVMYDKHNLTLWNEEGLLASQIIDVTDTLKPKPPTITSVNKTPNGDFMVQWSTNYPDTVFHGGLRFRVNYRKQGETEGVSEYSQVNSYDILGRRLEPNTQYVVTVNSKATFGGLYSDPCNQYFLTTPPVSNPRIKPIITVVVLCLIAVIAASAFFGLYSWVRGKWWDKFYKYPKTLLTIAVGEQKVLTPQDMQISPFFVEAFEKGASEDKQWLKDKPDSDSEDYQQSSGISTDSSLGYGKTVGMDVNIFDAAQEALRKALPHLALTSSATDDSRIQPSVDSSLSISDYNSCSSTEISPVHPPGLYGINNKTYSIVLPAHSQPMTSEYSAFSTQVSIPYDPAYHPSDGVTARNAPHDSLGPDIAVATQSDLFVTPVVSPHMQTDFSYQSCATSPGEINAPASCHTRVQDGYESFSQAVRGGRHALSEEIPDVCCDVNPFYMSHTESGTSPSPPPSDYQAFESVVGAPK